MWVSDGPSPGTAGEPPTVLSIIGTAGKTHNPFEGCPRSSSRCVEDWAGHEARNGPLAGPFVARSSPTGDSADRRHRLCGPARAVVASGSRTRRPAGAGARARRRRSASTPHVGAGVGRSSPRLPRGSPPTLGGGAEPSASRRRRRGSRRGRPRWPPRRSGRRGFRWGRPRPGGRPRRRGSASRVSASSISIRTVLADGKSAPARRMPPSLRLMLWPSIVSSPDTMRRRARRPRGGGRVDRRASV